jgi:hypothetical protein
VPGADLRHAVVGAARTDGDTVNQMLLPHYICEAWRRIEATKKEIHLCAQCFSTRSRCRCAEFLCCVPPDSRYEYK